MRFDLPPPNRPLPRMAPGAYKTYGLINPVGTHTVKVDCETYGCQNQRDGFLVPAMEGTPQGDAIAHAVRSQKQRGFTEVKQPDGSTHFIFEPGTECFAEHRMPIGRPPLYVVKDGDWRESHNKREHKRPEDWVEDFALNQQAVADAVQRG